MTESYPCSGNAVTERLRYFSGQLLQAEDFGDEQDYMLDRIRSHNRLHGHGVVCGLAVVPTDPPSGSVVVRPGVALDCCGREIVVQTPVEIDLTDKRGRSVLVTLGYGEEEVSAVPTGDPDQVQASRIREVPVIAATEERPEADLTAAPCHPCTDPALIIASVEVPKRRPIAWSRIDDSVRRTVEMSHNEPASRPGARWLRRGMVVGLVAGSIAGVRRLFQGSGKRA
jgi:hypothetical protein